VEYNNTEPTQIGSVTLTAIEAQRATVTATLTGDLQDSPEFVFCYATSESGLSKANGRMLQSSEIGQTITINLTGLVQNTTYYVKVYLTTTNGDYESSVVSFTTDKLNSFPVADAVDLGLPSGVKWASWNMGSSSPMDVPNTDYARYGWGDPTGEVHSLYSSDYAISHVAFIQSGDVVDIAETKYDIARVKWGPGWRLPRQKDLNELITKSTVTWGNYTDDNGKTYQGYKITGPNGNSIYLPAAGLKNSSGTLKYDKEAVTYWMSTNKGGVTIAIPTLYTSYVDFTSTTGYIYYQLPIRPVYDDGSGSTTPTDQTPTDPTPVTYDMSVVTITVTGSYTYNGSAITPQYVVKNGDETLTPGTDYDINITNNRNAGKATITCTGKGKYTGTKSATFEIKKAVLTVTAASVTTVYGAELPNLTYQIYGFVGSDGPSSLTTQPVATTEATSSSAPGSYHINVAGGVSQNYAFTYVAGTLTITPRDLSSATVTLDNEKYVYTGQPILPEVTVELDGKSLVRETDYDLTLCNNTNPGTASLIITGKGNYTGSIDTTFVIEASIVIMIIDGDTIAANLSTDGTVARYVSKHGWAWISGYNVATGENATLQILPDEGYVIDDVKMTGVADYTEDVASNGKRFTYAKPAGVLTVAIDFVEILPTCMLTIRSTSGGYVVYDNNTINQTTSSYTVDAGSSHTLSFVPASGYRLKSVIVNGTDVTSSVVNSQYTISGFSQNTMVSVTFEAIPNMTYSLTIVSSDGGSVLYSNTAINGTSSYTVDEGNSAMLNFSPNSGYRLASVKVNGTDVTSSVTNNQYTVSNIRQNTTVNVTFEVIPITTYTLTITSSNGGYVLYGEERILETTKGFVVDEGTSKKLTFEPANNYRIKSVVVNGTDVTASVVNNQYTISNVRQNTTVNVTFEVIPINTYSLTITSSQGGSVTYSGNTVNETTKEYTIEEGTNLSLTITPNSGYYLKSVLVNGIDVTASVVNNQYSISGITENTTIEVTFAEETKAMVVEDVNYTVTSFKDKTVNMAEGNYQRVLTVPASFTYDGQTWTVKGIESGALATATDLTAIIWNPNVAFTEKVANPNLLLYVKSSSYAPSSVNNVIVNNVATKITLTEAESGNDFYCPQAFTARSISYTHSYQMTTGIDKCQGWETIALPFDVQTIRHATKGIIVPFAARKNSSQKAFWLYELTSSGWKAASAIAANTPYIISMPNNDLYYDDVRLNGQVSFSATDVTVPVTNENTATYRGRTFMPNFVKQKQSANIFTINVNNEWYTNNTYGKEGSGFVVNQRSVSPFEGYMTATNGTRAWFGIFDDTTTEILGIEELIDEKRVNVYSINGQKRKVVGDESMDELKRTLPAGVYIINGKKVIVR